MALTYATIVSFSELLEGVKGGNKGKGKGSQIYGTLTQGVVTGLLGFAKLFGFGFADGGIVGGQNYNDGVVARVSSGEMVINQTDQKN